jgi:hypothetical protein
MDLETVERKIAYIIDELYKISEEFQMDKTAHHFDKAIFHLEAIEDIVGSEISKLEK